MAGCLAFRGADSTREGRPRLPHAPCTRRYRTGDIPSSRVMSSSRGITWNRSSLSLWMR